MSKFVVLKSAGLGNRIKLYVSYMQRYDELLIEKEPDMHLFENFKLCNKDEDIKLYPWTHSGWRLLVNDICRAPAGALQISLVSAIHLNTSSTSISLYGRN